MTISDNFSDVGIIAKLIDNGECDHLSLQSRIVIFVGFWCFSLVQDFDGGNINPIGDNMGRLVGNWNCVFYGHEIERNEMKRYLQSYVLLGSVSPTVGFL